jgi:hypothetical protein
LSAQACPGGTLSRVPFLSFLDSTAGSCLAGKCDFRSESNQGSRAKGFPKSGKGAVSAFESQGTDNGAVAIDVFVFDVIQQAAPSSDQHQKTPSGMVVLFVGFQMFGEIGNAVSQQPNLNFRRPCVGVVQFELVDQFLLVIGREYHFLFASSCSIKASSLMWLYTVK